MFREILLEAKPKTKLYMDMDGEYNAKYDGRVWNKQDLGTGGVLEFVALKGAKFRVFHNGSPASVIGKIEATTASFKNLYKGITGKELK